MPCNKPVIASVSGEFIEIDHAVRLMEESLQTAQLSRGSMSLHWLAHPSRGNVVLIQGANGEFALLH